MEQKTLEYEGSLCKEELILKVDSYRCKNRLFIAMIKKKDQEEELYDILTVSLPGENIKINEAFISDFECKYKLSFIRKYNIWKHVIDAHYILCYSIIELSFMHSTLYREI